MIVRGVARAGVVVLATILAGCIGAASPPPSVAPSPTRSPGPSPSLVRPPSQPVVPASSSVVPLPSVASPAPSATPEPSFPHADADLERYVPARIGSVKLIRWSLAGPDIPPAGGDMCLFLCGNEPREFAAALGIPLERVTVAFAMADAGGFGGIAFRAKGVATDRLAAGGVAITGGVVGGSGPSFPMTVAGRDVTFLYRPGRGQYLVPIDDVLVFLYGEPPMTSPGHVDPKGAVAPELVALIDALPR